MPSFSRIRNDFYPTHKSLTHELLKRVEISGKILECCSGDGAIASLFLDCISNDFHPSNGYEQNFRLDASDPESWKCWLPIDWVVTNPPFSLAPSILPLALENARVGVAALLWLSYLEPCANRAQWLQECGDFLSNLIILNPRPKFRSDTRGSDNVTVAWYVWQHGHQGGTKVTFVHGCSSRKGREP
jgi:hypothetical protein